MQIITDMQSLLWYDLRLHLVLGINFLDGPEEYLGVWFLDAFCLTEDDWKLDVVEESEISQYDVW